jgi:pyruvate,orthophosphate dikinase
MSQAADGVLTLQGGLSSHAAVIMRSLNKAVVADLEAMDVDWDNQTLTSIADRGKIARAGDKITIDGSSGRVYLGEKPITLANQDANFQTVMQWAERYKRLGVQAFVVNNGQVVTAKRLGAEGIGLYDTEEMFFEGGRLDLFRRWILTETTVERSNWSQQLLPLLQEHFLALFHALGNCELSVLLLDPPLATFLPDLRSRGFEDELREIAQRLDLDFELCQRRVMDLQESNPMLGLRGCRLSIVYPEITEMQVRAIVGAAVELKRRNFPVLPKIIVPLSFSAQEVDRVASLVCSISDVVCASAWEDASAAVQVLQHKVGCMIETPRACYKTDAIARVRHVGDVILNTDLLTSLVFGMADDSTEGFMVCLILFYRLALCAFAVMVTHIICYHCPCSTAHLPGQPPGGARPLQGAGRGRRGQHAHLLRAARAAV